MKDNIETVAYIRFIKDRQGNIVKIILERSYKEQNGMNVILLNDSCELTEKIQIKKKNTQVPFTDTQSIILNQSMSSVPSDFITKNLSANKWFGSITIHNRNP